MIVYVVNQNNEIIIELVCKAKTIRGIKSELKRTSFAIQDNWKIRIEENIN